MAERRDRKASRESRARSNSSRQAEPQETSIRFTVFTPTHRPDHLADAFDSLVAQTRADWEWVLVPNGPHASIPDRIAQDVRVRVVPAPDGVAEQGIGALKRFACIQARGTWLVEFDHDDLLVPNALERIDAFAGNRDSGFVFSDFANFRADGTCQVYDAEFGWESYPVEGNRGERYTAMRAFEPDASSLHRIHFAPNHVRAWHRDTYALAGAHDASLPVADDHDLVCRTWLTGAPFVHIPECLYLYRLLPDGRNTYVQRNAEIQERQQQMSNRYVYALIAEWCRRRALPMIDLGDASQRPPGYRSVAGRVPCESGFSGKKSVDGSESRGSGFTAAPLGAHSSIPSDDANAHVVPRGGLPDPDDSIGCVRAWDCLDRVPACADARCDHGRGVDPGRCVVGTMNEIYRVLAPGGWLLVRMPSNGASVEAPVAPHRSRWNPDTFRMFTQRARAAGVPGTRCRFQGARIWEEFPSRRHEEHGVPYVYADLVALKGQRQPGVCEI
ncbi:MAG: glycosyltransferase [Betaproteobacteria bacterium]